MLLSSPPRIGQVKVYRCKEPSDHFHAGTGLLFLLPITEDTAFVGLTCSPFPCTSLALDWIHLKTNNRQFPHTKIDHRNSCNCYSLC